MRGPLAAATLADLGALVIKWNERAVTTRLELRQLRLLSSGPATLQTMAAYRRRGAGTADSGEATLVLVPDALLTTSQHQRHRLRPGWLVQRLVSWLVRRHALGIGVS